jgi:uncharacterized RDD family membrane protein YckC
LIDGIIVNVVAFVIALAIGAQTNYWVTGLFSGLLRFVYFLAFESTQGWTPGKKVLGLSVRGPGGAPKPDVQQSAIRNVWTLLNIIPFIGGLLLLIGDRHCGDDQWQPDQAGQARRTRGWHPGGQGLIAAKLHSSRRRSREETCWNTASALGGR